ncbi:MAG: lanthionine synthetase LanC family protein [Pseudomonas proteolytica]|uniref:lanthionine synthetase LanC family protein n=1 Tax=Pseudomonas proteolytica TaxID=219574 RepID=UPI003F39D9C7
MSALHETLPQWWSRFSAAFASLELDAKGTLWMEGRSFTAQPIALSADHGGYDDDPRVERLQQYLYRHYYIGCGDDPNPLSAWYPAVAGPRDEGTWQVLEQLGGGALAVQQRRVTRRVEPGEYLFDGVPAQAIRGHHVQVRRVAWTVQLDPAFVYLSGEAAQDSCNEDCLVRYYLAPKPAQLGELIQNLTRTLEHACIPYLLKYPRDPRQWLRDDAVVLYIAARHAYSVHGVLGGCGRWLGKCLRGDALLWAKPLLPGLGFAQDPCDGHSFGESRCRALALGLLAAASQGTDVLASVQWQFEQQRIDWQHPHLESDPGDRFGLRQLRFCPHALSDDKTPPSALMQEAIQIGHQLCTDALWLGECCTWLNDDVDDAEGSLKAFSRSMNASLYDGTLGVAAFLVLLAEQTHQPRFVDTACGALRHALGFAAGNSLSLYEGHLGTVTQGLCLAGRLNDGELVKGFMQAAALLLQHLENLSAAPQPVDLMHGLAGAIIGLLALAQQAPQLALQSRVIAQALGQRLLYQAHRTEHGWHWPERGAHLGLCGLSHGNAGIALAFARLARDCPAPDWQPALERTLAYEAHWFVAQQGNWPYLFADDAQHLEDRPLQCGMAWCHGAPGIALSRLALWHLTGEDAYRVQAQRAMETVAAHLWAATSQADGSYTLCHGPAGNADILLTGAAMLGVPEWAECAQHVARRGLAVEGGHWRSGLGVAQGQSLGLMLGLAGTGYFLLRCAGQTSVPSLLLPWGMLEPV